ncbi:hypothetical protein CYR55_22995, partial [Chimaeribacter californicus]
MSDEVDRLAEAEQKVLEKQIQMSRNSAGAQLMINGYCHYCDEVCGQRPFCDEHCSEDWHKERDAQVRNFGVHPG